ncbi:MAG: discoidin domain-containing protein [Bacteroidaceae bacterium]|nr:discoidin domain-containing protein [Bacteroidaceae bacterium]
MKKVFTSILLLAAMAMPFYLSASGMLSSGDGDGVVPGDSVASDSTEAYVPEFEYQKYLIYNVGAGMYWGAGNSWGTQASLVAHPEYAKLVPQEAENIYHLESQVNNGGTQYYFNGDYMDNGSPVALTVSKLENGHYTIAAADGGLYGYDGASTVLGKGLTTAAGANVEWTIVSLADAKANLANATLQAPIDATFLIEDHDFGRNNRYVSSWTIEASNKNLSGGNNTNNCAESYHSVFSLSQALADAPAGVYSLTAQGFYRQDGEDNDNLPVFFANDVTATFPLKTGSENSMSDASVSFSAGNYTIEPIFVKVEEGGTLTIGAKLENNTNLWCIWDNFVLTYYGAEASLDEAKFAGLVAQVNELKAQAEELKAEENVSAATVAAVEAAIAGAESIEATEEAYTAAIAALDAAVQQAKKDVANKPAIDAMYAVLASTNVYTAEAAAAYKAEADGYKEAYEAGTLTATVDNPATVHGWHASNSYDNLLLSAWTINDVQCDEFATALYINTWSTEGENDSTEFKVPFYEYWTGDDNSLGATTMTAKVNGLEKGIYEVSAWVRVRAKNGVAATEATGITLSANGGAAVDVTEGAQVGTGQFNIAEYKARGIVGEDSTLTITFTVAADNNISWLSFKNVTFVQRDETEVAYEDALASIEDGGTYRVFAQVDSTKYYLNSTGFLVTDVKKAATFTFNAVNADKTLYPTGWNLGCKFTNPSLTNGASGDVVQKGQIMVGSNDRNDWERQVFFLKDGQYKVRATNANSANWGANTYWAVVLGADSLPQAGYVLAENADYQWQLEANVDNRPAAFAQVQTWAGKLQAIEGLVTEATQWTSNAKEPSEGSYEALTDGDYTTFFHSQWSGTGPDADHYLQAELPEAQQEFYFYFKKRSQNNNNRPTDILIQGSNDGETFTDITEITEGLPTGATPIDYTSAKITATEAYKYIRFTVKAIGNSQLNNGHPYFTFSEFYILPSSGLTAAVAQYMVGDYTDLADDDVEPINALAARIDAAYQVILDAEAIASTKAEILEVVAVGNEISQKAKQEDMFAKDDVDAKVAAITTLDEAKAGLAEVKRMVYEYVAEIGEVAEDIDITNAFIVNPTPMKKDGWEGTDFGTASNGVSEYWNKAAAEFHQTINLPAGSYKLTVVALQRTDMTGYVYAGDAQTVIAQVANTEVNNRAEAATWFAAGNGVNVVKFTVAEAGDITIGLKADEATGDHWTVWQSFKLEIAAPEPEPVDPNDYTSYIINANLKGEGGFDATGTKGIDGSGIVKAGNNAKFNFSQVIKNLPAGQYKLTAQAAYRYSGTEEDEAAAIAEGKAETKLAKMYANTGADIAWTLVQNRWDGASEVDYFATGEGVATVNGKFVPNSSAAVKAWFEAGQYVNEVVFNLVENGDVTIGIEKTAEPEAGDYTVIGPWTLTRIGDAIQPEPIEPAVLEKTINVERYLGLGYAAQTEEFDADEAKTFLGVEKLTYDMLRIVNPDSTEISDYAPFDGWFNGEGVAETWGNNTKVCVKFFQVIPNGTYEICDMNGADVLDAVYTVKWALVNGDKKVVYNINVKFVEKPAITLTFADLAVVDSTVVIVQSELGKSYEDLKASVDMAAIYGALGLDGMAHVAIYAVQSDGSLDDMYGLGTTDGWRNADGDWQTWGENAYFCVKADFTAETEQIYYIGGMDGKNTADDWQNPGTYTATYAFVSKESANHAAVVLKVTLSYAVPTGISSISSDLENASIYDLSGRKVSKIQKGGIYIVNGKKVSVK